MNAAVDRIYDALIGAGVDEGLATRIAMGYNGALPPERFLLRLADACERASDAFVATTACARRSLAL